MENKVAQPLFREAVSLLQDPDLSYAIKVLFYTQSEPGEIEKLQKFIALRQASLGVEIAWSLSDDNFVSALRDYAMSFVSEAQAEHPEIADLVEASAPREMLEAIDKQLRELPAYQRRRFTEALANNFIEQLKKQGVRFENLGVSESQLRGELLERTIEISFDAKTDREFSEQATRQIENVFRVRAPSLAISSVVENVIKEYTPLYQKVLSDDDLPRKIQDAVITAPTTRKDIFAKVLTELSLNNPKATQGSLCPRALELTRAAEALTSDFVPNEQETKLPGFFRSYATTVPQKALAPVADFLFGRLSSKRRAEVVESHFARALGSVLQNTDLLTTKFGSGFVSSGLFQNYIQTSGMALASPSTPAKTGVARGIFDDFIGSILAGTAVGGFFGIPETPVLNAIELNAIGIFAAPFVHKPSSRDTPKGFRRSAVGGRTIGLFPLLPAQGTFFSWNLLDLYHVLISQKVGSSRLEGLLDKATGKIVWIFRFGSLPFSKKKNVAGATQKPTSALGLLLGNMLRVAMGERFGFTIGRFVGDAVSSVVGKIVRLIPLVALVGFVSKIFSGGINLLRFGVRKKTRWQDDWPLIAAIVIVATIVLLFIFPNVFNFTKNSDTTRLAALVTGFGGDTISAPEQVCDPTSDPSCAVAYCDPTKQDCSWPTSCGCVTQGPYDGAGQTHEHLNAIDVGISSCGTNHVDVRATHDGTIVGLEDGYTENEFAHTYGNYVRLMGTDSRGNKFYTIYAHLWVIAEYKNTGRILQTGDVLSRGDPIGKTDNNGLSYGEHLHYGYLGGGDISTILPTPVPHCAFGTCPNVCW